MFDSLSIVAGTTIGSGIFIVSAGIAREVHSPALLLLVWIAASLMSLTGALTIAELAAMIPVAGGQYVFLRESYGGLCAFLFGWTIVAVVHTGSVAAVSIVFAKYLAVLIPAIHSQWRIGVVTFQGERIVAIALITTLTYANVRGLHAGRAVQNLFTVAKISALILIVVLALAILPNHAALHANFGSRAAFLGHGGLSLAILPAFGAAMIGAMFSLGGSENLIALGAGSLFGVLGIAAVFVMRFRHPHALRPYRVWGYPWIPSAHLLGSLAIFVDLLMVKTRYRVFGLVIVSCAIPVYFWRKRHNLKFEDPELEHAVGLRPAFATTNQSETV